MFYILLLELANFKTNIEDIFYYQLLKKNKYEVKQILNQKGPNYFLY